MRWRPKPACREEVEYGPQIVLNYVIVGCFVRFEAGLSKDGGKHKFSIMLFSFFVSLILIFQL